MKSNLGIILGVFICIASVVLDSLIPTGIFYLGFYLILGSLLWGVYQPYAVTDNDDFDRKPRHFKLRDIGVALFITVAALLPIVQFVDDGKASALFLLKIFVFIAIVLTLSSVFITYWKSRDS